MVGGPAVNQATMSQAYPFDTLDDKTCKKCHDIKVQSSFSLIECFQEKIEASYHFSKTNVTLSAHIKRKKDLLTAGMSVEPWTSLLVFRNTKLKVCTLLVCLH